MIAYLALAALVATAANAQECQVGNLDRVDCGTIQTQEPECIAKGCCWSPVQDDGSTPWCFYQDGQQGPQECEAFNWEALDPGFTQNDFDAIYENYRSQLNIDGTGAVVASPDTDTPGGSYYYHWMRDGALSIKTWIEINNNDLDVVRREVDPYVDWVEIVQSKPNPNGIDPRCEAKFDIPTASPYTGGWCRPQNDGPALRAMALCYYGTLLLEAGETDYVDRIWGIVSYDLEWVLENWFTEGCDLWEEVRSDNFYFNRMAYIYSLNEVAKFADLIGEDGDIYRNKAEEIRPSAEEHWTGSYIYESDNRRQDSAVLHSIATFGEYLYPANSEEAAATIDVLAHTFCNEYQINQQEVGAGEPGVLFGRYPGDSYAGGNPWPLLTAVAAEVFYLGAEATFKDIEARGAATPLDVEANKNWMKLLNLEEGKTDLDLAQAQISAGDAVMTRLYAHVGFDGGIVDEQIDRNTGFQTAAESLTWSYANILHALYVREENGKLMERVLAKLSQ